MLLNKELVSCCIRTSNELYISLVFLVFPVESKYVYLDISYIMLELTKKYKALIYKHTSVKIIHILIQIYFSQLTFIQVSGATLNFTLVEITNRFAENIKISSS